jgi:hypothetical protein
MAALHYHLQTLLLRLGMDEAVCEFMASAIRDVSVDRSFVVPGLWWAWYGSLIIPSEPSWIVPRYCCDMSSAQDFRMQCCKKFDRLRAGFKFEIDGFMSVVLVFIKSE